MENNPDLLQVAEVLNADAYLTAYANKINEDYENMNITEKEDQNTVEYQETLKIDVKNINKNKTLWIPIYEVIDATFFLRNRYFTTKCFRLM